MGKLQALLLVFLPLALTAQMEGGFGDDFERPDRGGPRGKPPMDGGKMNPFGALDSFRINDQKAFESAFASVDITNRNAEAFIKYLEPLATLPTLSVQWVEIRDVLRKRGTQGEKNEALKLHREYLSCWDTLIAALDSVTLDSAWAKDEMKKENTDHLDSLKSSFVLMRDSIAIAMEMNRKSSSEIETRLQEARGMLTQINSNSERPEQASTIKTMLFSLKVDIINMENDIEILNREFELGEGLLGKLNEFI